MKTLTTLLLLAASCADNLQVPDTEVTPVAVARVLPGASLVYAGKPLSVTLDGSQSRDPDGTIRSYRWLSATSPDRVGVLDDDAGTPSAGDRWVPAGAPADWPDDVVQPVVTLPDVGNYAFSLWVIDDRGRISDPSTVTLRVQRAP